MESLLLKRNSYTSRSLVASLQYWTVRRNTIRDCNCLAARYKVCI